MNKFTKIPLDYHKLPFHLLGTTPDLSDLLADSSCELLWHQYLIHCGEHTLKDIHKQRYS